MDETYIKVKGVSKYLYRAVDKEGKTVDFLLTAQRDKHITLIAAKGRLGWQKETGYGRRSLVETAMGRYKAIIGPNLRARSMPSQRARKQPSAWRFSTACWTPDA